MPCDYSKYPKSWKKIREEILERAKYYCEFCGVRNYSIRWSESAGKHVEIVLTVAHLNHNTKDNRRKNLKALCQRCHNRHDSDYRARNRKRSAEARRIESGQTQLNFVEQKRTPTP